MSSLGLGLLLLASAWCVAALRAGDYLSPRFHPLGGLPAGTGDVTGAIFINGTWSVWAVGEPWALMQSEDLVHWRDVATDIGFSGTTGAIALAENGTPYAIHPCGPGYCAAIANDTSLQHWHQLGMVVSQAQQTPWLPFNGPDRPGNPSCTTKFGQGNGYQYMDTVTPYQKDGEWRLVAPIQGCNDRLRQGRDNAQALLFSSPKLFGPGCNWTYRGVFFATNETVLPHRPPWVDMIDSDYFEQVPGDPSDELGVFTNSWAGGPTENPPEAGRPIWNQVQWWVGKTIANGSFVPINSGAMDYGQYKPAPNTPLGYDIATNGGAQYYTPKSGAGQGGRGRRVVFSWLEDGLTGAAPGTADRLANCRALPRDWSIDAETKTVLQQPVPELSTLRMPENSTGNHVSLRNHSIQRGVDWGALRTVKGAQLEINAKIRLPPQGGSLDTVGLIVLGEEANSMGGTTLGVNLTAGLIFLERQLGVSGGVDVRAGPLPVLKNGTLELHIFVDGSVVELFANNRTTMSAWSFPAAASYDGLALFASCTRAAEGCAAELLELSVWRLQSVYPPWPRPAVTHQ